MYIPLPHCMVYCQLFAVLLAHCCVVYTSVGSALSIAMNREEGTTMATRTNSMLQSACSSYNTVGCKLSNNR
jgi:hypothetical protein